MYSFVLDAKKAEEAFCSFWRSCLIGKPIPYLFMMLSNIAIEFNRSCPNVKVLALHPGTVDTNLSSPFSKNMNPDHLFTPEYSVKSMMDVIESVDKNPLGAFYAWDGEKIPWWKYRKSGLQWCFTGEQILYLPECSSAVAPTKLWNKSKIYLPII